MGIDFLRPGLKTGVRNGIFWSEIGAGFGNTGGTPPPKIPRRSWVRIPFRPEYFQAKPSHLISEEELVHQISSPTCWAGRKFERNTEQTVESF